MDGRTYGHGQTYIPPPSEGDNKAHIQISELSIVLPKLTVKGRLCGSVAQLAECSHGKRQALGSSPGRAKIFSSLVTFGGSVWVRC